jgi:hypothetical protein
LEKDWKSALISGIKDIRQSWHLLFPKEILEIPSVEFDSDPMLQLFHSANCRLLASWAFKIIQNLEVAAFHLAYLLKVKLLIHNLVPHFISFYFRDNWTCQITLSS